MDEMIEKLADIENKACKILDDANIVQTNLEKKYQNLTKEFDIQTENETNQIIANYQDFLEKKNQEKLNITQKELSEQLSNIKKDYNDRHDEFTNELLQQLTSV